MSMSYEFIQSGTALTLAKEIEKRKEKGLTHFLLFMPTTKEFLEKENINAAILEAEKTEKTIENSYDKASSGIGLRTIYNLYTYTDGENLEQIKKEIKDKQIQEDKEKEKKNDAERERIRQIKEKKEKNDAKRQKEKEEKLRKDIEQQQAVNYSVLRYDITNNLPGITEINKVLKENNTNHGYIFTTNLRTSKEFFPSNTINKAQIDNIKNKKIIDKYIFFESDGKEIVIYTNIDQGEETLGLMMKKNNMYQTLPLQLDDSTGGRRKKQKTRKKRKNKKGKKTRNKSRKSKRQRRSWYK